MPKALWPLHLYPSEIFPRQPAPSTSPHFTAKFTKNSNRGRAGICLNHSESARGKGSKVCRVIRNPPPEQGRYPENSGFFDQCRQRGAPARKHSLEVSQKPVLARIGSEMKAELDKERAVIQASRKLVKFARR